MAGDSSEDFDWSGLAPEEKVQHELRAVGVYLNTSGNILIRQRADWPNERDDPFIVLSRDAADRLAKRLRELVAESYGDPTVP
jgi:hypothetical protein